MNNTLQGWKVERLESILISTSAKIPVVTLFRDDTRPTDVQVFRMNILNVLIINILRTGCLRLTLQLFNFTTLQQKSKQLLQISDRIAYVIS